VRNIFYLGETWIESSLTYKKGCQKDEKKGVVEDENTRKMLVVLYAFPEGAFWSSE
jgi:hypothetical protein